jgi:hypothetical protein
MRPAVIALAFAITSPAAATTFSTTALNDIAGFSSAAISGDVIAKKTLRDPKGVPWTIYTLAVDGVLAGEFAGSEFSFRVIGGENPDGSTLVIVGTPQFAVGDSIVMLYDPAGACQVAGYEFGAFWRRTNEAGESRLVNYLGQAIASFAESGPLLSDEVISTKGSLAQPAIAAINDATKALATTGVRPPAARADIALDQLQAFAFRYVVQATRVTSTSDLTNLPDLSPGPAPADKGSQPNAPQEGSVK